jgi:FtsZ-binding cell division protein ZapB
MSLDALKALEERIDKAVGTITQLKKDKEQLEGENAQLKSQVDSLNKKMKKMEERGGDLESLQNENRQLKEAHDELKGKLEGIIGKLEKFQE